MANRRIQNIEKSGVFSPALAHLGKDDIKGYSKFSIKGFGNTGESWTALKVEYGKCVAFLNQPTSLAQGAKEFETQVKANMGISDELWSLVRENVLGGMTDSVQAQLIAALPYTKFMEKVYQSATYTAGNEMEDLAVKVADQLQQEVDKAAEKVGQITEDWANSFKMMF